jgi:hypothetical protein
MTAALHGEMADLRRAKADMTAGETPIGMCPAPRRSRPGRH